MSNTANEWFMYGMGVAEASLVWGEVLLIKHLNKKRHTPLPPQFVTITLGFADPDGSGLDIQSFSGTYNGYFDHQEVYEAALEACRELKPENAEWSWGVMSYSVREHNPKR